MTNEQFKAQADRLHHFSMIYCGAIYELAAGKQILGLPIGHPGLKEVRDVLDLILFLRAEINAMSKILLEAKLITPERFQEIMGEEYKWLADQKELFFKVKSTPWGLEYNAERMRHE